MSVVTVLLLALGIAVAVAVKSKKLSITALLVCGSFGLLLGTTAVGRLIGAAVLVVGLLVAVLGVADSIPGKG